MSGIHPARGPASSPVAIRKLRTGPALVALLCAAWCGTAPAVEIVYQGPDGSSGLTGATPGAAGTAGGLAALASYALAGTDPVNSLSVIGGLGGNGGNGANGNPGQDGGAAGAGGAGAQSIGVLSVNAPAAGATLSLTSTGGAGGNAGTPGQPGSGAVAGAGASGGVGGVGFANGVLVTSGAGAAQAQALASGGRGGLSSGGLNSVAGGDAISNLTAVALGSGPLDVTSRAVGGQGGAATAEGATAGAGGDASATGGLGNPTATLSAYTHAVHATGGAGGEGNLDFSGAPHASGGRGGNASANTSSAYSSGTLILTQSATGGAGGATIFGFGGRGGDARSTVSTGLGGALNVTVDSTATGGAGGGAAGDPFGGLEFGTPGAGGNAVSDVTLSGPAPAAGSWNAVITATSSALAGDAGLGAFPPSGGSADASLTVAGYGRVTGTAVARGSFGGDAGGAGTASASIQSNYSAVAKADAGGGGAFFNPGAAASATARATSAYHASADAIAMSGSGRFGNADAAIASATAAVDRPLDAPVPPPSPLVAEARAHALASFQGGEVVATSRYRDAGTGASVTATAASGEPARFYQPEAFSAANVGGAAYGPWTPDVAAGAVVAYASALPDPASLSGLFAAAPNVSAAFADADVLGAGTVGAMFFPFVSTAEFSVPFTAGRHLLLGLGLPFQDEFSGVRFEFSVSRGGTSLYAGSFTSPEQAALFFTDNVLDLGVIDSNTLDLLLRFSAVGGIYGFSYVVGAGDALAPIPEPGTWLMLVLGLAVLTWRLRGRQPHVHICRPSRA